jgi:hypothetical protein
MATSKTKAKTPTSAKDWKGRVQGNLDLELPSGNVCLVRPFTIAKLISENLLPDSLTPIAQDMVDRGKGKPPADFKKKKSNSEEISKDPKALSDMFDLIDRVSSMVVVAPELRYHKEEKDGQTVEIPFDDREEDVLYTDEIDIQDKMFIFNWVVGGTTDLERFREQFGESLGGLSAVAIVQ